jgi:splicing factor 45
MTGDEAYQRRLAMSQATASVPRQDMTGDEAYQRRLAMSQPAFIKPASPSTSARAEDPPPEAKDRESAEPPVAEAGEDTYQQRLAMPPLQAQATPTFTPSGMSAPPFLPNVAAGASAVPPFPPPAGMPMPPFPPPNMLSGPPAVKTPDVETMEVELAYNPFAPRPAPPPPPPGALEEAMKSKRDAAAAIAARLAALAPGGSAANAAPLASTEEEPVKRYAIYPST